MDKITSSESPLKLSKKLFLKSNTDKGEEISEITEDTQLNVGDLVRVRIELHSDRDMEFVHLKDMRVAGFEPINVLSQYKWQDGLGYYESTKDTERLEEQLTAKLTPIIKKILNRTNNG